MSVVETRARRERLFNPPNAVPDHGIDLKRKPPSNHVEAPVDDKKSQIAAMVERMKALQAEINALRASEPPPPKVLMIADIISAVSDKFGVTKIDLLSARRTARFVWPRHVIMYLARYQTMSSFPEIGRRLGGKDHSSVIHACRKVAAAREADPSVDALLTELEAFLGVAYPCSNNSQGAPCNSAPNPTSTAP